MNCQDTKSLFCPAGKCICKYFVDLELTWACSLTKVYNESFDVCPWPLRKQMTEDIELKTLKKYNLSPKEPNKPIKPEDDFLSVSEAATLLKRKKNAIYQLTHKNLIKFYKPNGRIILFKRSDLIEWIEKSKIPTNDEIETAAALYMLNRKK